MRMRHLSIPADRAQNVRLHAMISQRLSEHRSDQIFNFLKTHLQIDDADIARAYYFYDSDVFAYDNEVYASYEIRFVQYLHARNSGSWHIEKHNCVNEFLKRHWPCTVVDIGFGIPQSYVLDRIPIDDRGRFTLLDKYMSALKFSQCMLDFVWPNWHRSIRFGEIDLAQNFSIKPHDVYLLLDSIEHAINPTEGLRRLVSTAKNNSKFFLSLPIGSKVPVHYIEWLNEQDALDWLKANGLEVVIRKMIRPNPRVDIFAESVEGDY